MTLQLVSEHSVFLSHFKSAGERVRWIELVLVNSQSEPILPGLLRLEGRFQDETARSHKLSIANGWAIQSHEPVTLQTMIREAPALQSLEVVDYLEFGGRIHPARGRLARGSFGGLSMIEGSA